MPCIFASARPRPRRCHTCPATYDDHVGLKVSANGMFVARSQFVIALLELYLRRPEPSVFECYPRSLSAFMLSGLPLLLLTSVQFPRDCTRQRFFGIRGGELRVLSGHAPSSEQGLAPFMLLVFWSMCNTCL